jgi:hypothetical protein
MGAISLDGPGLKNFQRLFASKHWDLLARSMRSQNNFAIAGVQREKGAAASHAPAFDTI